MLPDGSWQSDLFLHVAEGLLLKVISWRSNGVSEELCDVLWLARCG